MARSGAARTTRDGAAASWVIAGALPALLLGCGDDSRPGTLSDGAFIGGCNIALAECQAAVFDATSKIRGQSGVPRPTVRTITGEQAARELGAQPGTEADLWGPAMRLLGLRARAPASPDSEIGSLVEQVAAFYDPRSKGVTIIDRGEPADPLNDTFVLAHEFVHALQDADVGLAAFREAWVTSSDSLVASDCLTEGEAMVLGLGVLADALERPYSALDWDGAAEAGLDALLEGVESEPSKFLYAAQGLPYSVGLSALAPRWLSRGQEAFDELYAEPVLSVADWANASLDGQSSVEALDCYPTQGPPGYSAVDHDFVGATGFFALAVAMGATGEESWARARDARNDAVVLYRSDADPESFAVAWRIRSPQAMWLGTVVERGSGDLRVRFAGDEVLIFGSTEPGIADTWDGASHCGTAAELPPSAAASGQRSAAARRLQWQPRP